MKREERYRRVLDYFCQQMPEVNTELEYGSVFQLLVAVILSAQCTDKRINQVTPELFKHFPDARTMAEAETAIRTPRLGIWWTWHAHWQKTTRAKCPARWTSC